MLEAWLARGSRSQVEDPTTAKHMTASTTRATPPSMPRIFTFKSLNSRISVRSRIAAIAVIPVVGFLANGIAFTTGETGVESAFLSVQHATAVAEASEGFKAGLAAMRIGLRDFIADSNQESITAFDAGSKQAAQSLVAIENSLNQSEGIGLSALNRSIAAARDNFLAVKKEQEILGFTEAEGV